MTDRTPVEVTNLDQYGNPALPWSRARDALATPPEHNISYFLGTVRPNGRPHAAAVGAIWHNGDLYFVSGPKARKARNLAANPACTISVSMDGIDIEMEGEARRVTDKATLERVAKVYSDGGWPATVEGDAFTAPFFAPSGGPPPWYLYHFALHTAFGVATAKPDGATRWRLAI